MKEGQGVLNPSPPSDDDVVLFGEESGDEEEGSNVEEMSANGQAAQSMDTKQSAQAMDMKQSAEPIVVEEGGASLSLPEHAAQHADASIADSVMTHSGPDVSMPSVSASDEDDGRDDARMNGEEGARGQSYVDECTIEELLGECKDLGNVRRAPCTKAVFFGCIVAVQRSHYFSSALDYAHSRGFLLLAVNDMKCRGSKLDCRSTWHMTAGPTSP